MVNWKGEGVYLTCVYVHSAICETCIVYWYSIDVCLIGMGYIRPGYMCILLYLKLMWCSSIPYIYGQLEGDIWYMTFFYMGVYLTCVYVHSAICETCIVYWYSIDVWLIGMGYI